MTPLSRALASCLALFLLPAAASAASPPLLSPPPAAGPGWMFDPSVMVDVQLTIPQSSLDQIPGDLYAERVYVPATFYMSYADPSGHARTYGPWAVTLKVKGMYGSFRNLAAGEKAGLKIKFPSGRRPDGLKKFTLNNMVQDGSMVREVLAYEVFRAMGVASPRTGYARVTINGVYYGIYLNVETMDNLALPRWFGSTGHLYEGSYGTWWGDMTDPFSGHYEVDEGDEDNREDLRRLIEVSRGPAAGWFARMQPVADLEQMSMMWACEWFTGHWDGYSQHLPNNYYLHADASGRFSMMPWGTDQSFQWAARFERNPDHFIFSNSVRDPIGRAMYTDALQRVAEEWVRLRLAERADEVHAMVAGESHGVDDVKWFVANRLEEHRAWASSLPSPPLGVSVARARGSDLDIEWRRTRLPSSPSTGFAVEYRAAGGAWQRVARNGNSTRCTLRGLPPGDYEVRVRIVGKFGDSLPVTVRATVP